MTAQLGDAFLWQGASWGALHRAGTGWFSPREQGVEPAGASTACALGFRCQYRVQDSLLFLDQVDVSLGYLDGLRVKRGRGPQLFGRQPRPCEEGSLSRRVGLAFTYDGPGTPLPVSGGILLARGRRAVTGLPPPSRVLALFGHHSALQAESVYELLLEQGRLVSATDCTPRLEQARAALAERALREGWPTVDGDQEAAVVNPCFQLDYWRTRAGSRS